MSGSARAQPARRPGGALFGATAFLIYLALLNSLLALHVFPALAGSAVVLLAGLIARNLGGGRFAQDLATLVAPSFLVMGTFLSMDAFDQLWWVLASYLLLPILKRDRLWLVFGLVAGL